MSQETETRREIANRLEAVVKVLNPKIGKYGSATHHLSNVAGAMSSAFMGSTSHRPDVVQSAGRVSAAPSEEDLNEWRSIVSDTKPYLDEASHKAEAATSAKDQFPAVLSHELRTPLTPTMMAASRLRNAQEISEQARNAFDMIFRNVELEARLIDDLLDLTRIGPKIISKIFVPFEQGANGVLKQFGGLGLALAISKAVFDAHGGAITVRSEGKNLGAAFSVRLRLTSSAMLGNVIED